MKDKINSVKIFQGIRSHASTQTTHRPQASNFYIT